MYSCIKGLLAVKVTGISTTSEEVILRVETITTSAKVVETSVATAKKLSFSGMPHQEHHTMQSNVTLLLKPFTVQKIIQDLTLMSRAKSNRDEQFLLLQFLYKWDIANK